VPHFDVTVHIVLDDFARSDALIAKLMSTTPA
jgi:hypothetical protein